MPFTGTNDSDGGTNSIRYEYGYSGSYGLLSLLLVTIIIPGVYTFPKVLGATSKF
jgi:hypothetical protein